jgi:hypothetical protein
MVLLTPTARKRSRPKLESVRLPWGPWRILELEDIPQGALLYHLQDDELPAGVRIAVERELLLRLETLLVWAEVELSQQGIDVGAMQKTTEAVRHALDRLQESARAAS